MGLGEFVAVTVFGLGGSAKIVAAAIEAALSIGLSTASKALAGKPKAAERPGRSTNVRSTTMAHQVVLGQARKGGLLAYVNGTGEKNKFLHNIIILAAHECDSITELYISGQLVTVDANDSGNVSEPSNSSDKSYHDYAWLAPYLGTSSQSADANLVSETATTTGSWTANHRLRGRCYIYGKFRESPARYGGIPAVTATIKGINQIFDPRANSGAGATGWSDNPALQAAWIAETYLKIPRARIDVTALTAAANVCDETVGLKAGGTQKRYTSNGYIDLEGDPANWLEPIIASMAGAFIEHGGTYFIHAGKYTSSVLTITDDDFIGSGDITVRTSQSSIERANTIKGLYVGPGSFDQPTEFPIVVDSAMLTEDGNITKTRDLDGELEFCNTHQQAQRVAKIMLRRQRHAKAFTCDVHLRVGLDIKPWDLITVTSLALGITGTYKVMSHILITEADGPAAFVRLSLQEYASSIYDWTASTDEQDNADIALNLPNNESAPAVQVHSAGDSVSVPSSGVDNDTGNVGDIVIDLEDSKIYRKKGAFGS